MTKELQAAIHIITDALQYKSVTVNDNDIEFYWDSLLKPDLSEQGLLWAIKELEERHVIQGKKLQYEEPKPQSTRSRLAYATSTHSRAVWTYKIDRENLGKFLESARPKYRLGVTKTREILINDKYVIGKPHFASKNHDFIEYAINHPNTTITRELLQAEKLQIGKKFAQIITDLGFVDELKRVFFPNASIKAVEFRNNLADADLKELGIDETKLQKQLRSLPQVGSKSRNGKGTAGKKLK